MNGYLSIISAVAVAALLGRWFIRNERRRTPERTVLFFLGFLIFEAALYQSQTRIPVGLVHPGLGVDSDPTDHIIETAFSFRLLDILIPLALWARLIGSRARGGVAIPTLVWTVFLSWLALAGMEGFVFGNRVDLLLFEGKAIVYVGLLFVVLGADVGKMLRSRPFERLLGVAAIVALILTSLDAVGVEVDLVIPILPLSSFGLVGADAASVFGALGLITLALGVTRASNRLPMLGMAAAFLAPALVAQQRAALLGLAVSMLVIAAIALTARHRLRLTLAEGTLVVIATVFVVGTVTLVGSGIQGTSLTLPFANSIEQAFGREDKAVSAQSRVSQWRAAPDVFRERPFVGSGLGTTYQFYDPGPKEFIQSNLTHNIGLDLLIRTGAIGLALFGLALLTSLWAGIRAWRGVLDPVLAAIGLACAAIIAGLVAKGMVESLFEKYRLVALMGLLVGIGLAALSRDLTQRSAKTGGGDGALA